ncbi:MAG: hypothetical protein A2921_00940 [Candidatus Magasanikbacteria bacterium RIFCSPLOWO2_01_FULL_43_20b]|uniref:PEP-utilising enzyme mobile domain-containing protein n=1 Tax=Candidatus Magasanikbacteria bacterium RIFCSPLOWO2_12_FULL_43_12 TaxID=1798692 RepID=A0A1F6MQJ0_9BACT|nr:MAG: hypothetical protein A3I93_02835 [Candidatus Magasanikbacteria bacterium RIFCSPLOWO2_02_FULL_43_22]OGH73110.1 MAG: hypothetical protein A2921_00940 [Candidatus Magasanikbacteria bacterium RIFCSPLOWO2_01_FULL_43_20b]OGH73931.1 MAG: hypothetical protein A3G00_03425 [Candidatus Magasanikbacteria bacterium RIFCSPLOWO2_12_FULL_43_12]OGT21057.1 MAG: hypothetical protein A3C55_01160 [Gammaproteobacteria bacterium RIFCSPHIGHO2_02_FULL_42_13]
MIKIHAKNDPWMLGEEIPDCDLFFSTLWLYCFTNDFVRNTGRAYGKILAKFTGYHLWFYFGEKDSFEVGKNIANRIINEPGYAGKINKNIIIEADKLRAYAKTIPQKNLDKLSNKALWQIYKIHNEIHNHYYTWCWIPVAADMFHNNLTDRVKEYLRGLGVSDDKLTEYFITLTQPTKKSLIFIEQQELLRIGEKIEKNGRKITKQIQNDIKKHWRKYYYTKHLWVKGEYKIEDYEKQLREVLSGKESCGDIIKKQSRELKLSAIKKRKLLKELKVSKQWQDVFYAFGDFMVTKIYRRYAQIFAVYQMGNILREIAKRFYLTEKQVRFMMKGEVEKMLLKGRYEEQELLARTKMCVYYAEKGMEKVFVKKEAEKLLARIQKKDYTDIKELKGETACAGYVKGKVKIIIRAEDMKKMNDGDILVSIATDPDIVPAMKRAAAIVTEQGGVTSHAAIVSRELNIPCVIGTKIATKVLKDGDEVEVDANNGVVTKLH